MTERYFKVIRDELPGKPWGKGIGAYLLFTPSERSAFKKQWASVNQEFVEKHPKRQFPYGTVFHAKVSRGYPKPVLSATHMPKSAVLHPKKTPRNKDGLPKLPEFGTAGLYGEFFDFVSDRLKEIIEELEPGKYAFFSYELHDTLYETTLQYWIIYALSADNMIDYPASLYRWHENGAWVRTALTSAQVFKLDAGLVEGRHLILCPEIENYIFSETFLNKAGDFLRRNQRLEELEVVSGELE